MSVQPIDLQTLFAHMNQVGKDQAVEKDAAAIQQSLQGSKLAKETEEKDHIINQTKELEDGPESIKEDKKRKKEKESNKKDKTGKGEDTEDKDVEDILSDPDLGANIDISR